MTTEPRGHRVTDAPSVLRAADLADTELPPAPLAPADVVTGPAEVRHLPLLDTADLGVGLWQHGPGVSADVEAEELFVVLRGRATIQVHDGPTLDVRAGDVVRLPAGARTVWTVHETLRKVYVLAPALARSGGRRARQGDGPGDDPGDAPATSGGAVLAERPSRDSALRRLVDPESLPALDALFDAFPEGLRAIGDVPARRAALTSGATSVENPGHAETAPGAAVDVDVEDRNVSVAGADRPVRVRIYRPQLLPDSARPGILYIHGGGLIYGDLDAEDDDARYLAASTGAVVVSVDYRLAPEHPYPAAVTDCVTALAWMTAEAMVLGVDRHRIAVFGGSAGGCLAIATALYVRDNGGPDLALVMAPYPMLDDANDTPSSHEITDLGIWDRADNLEAWRLYLADRAPGPYAVPARTEDLSGLPPMFLDVGTVDLFRDETIAFAQRLTQATVPVELHVYPGAYHASESIARDTEQAAMIWAARTAALSRALGP